MVSSFFKNLRQKFASLRYAKAVPYVVISVATISLLVNLLLIYRELKADAIDPVNVIGLMLPILLVSFFLAVFLINNHSPGIFNLIKQRKKRISRLKKRVILAFSLGAAVPALVVAVFSTYFFKFGVQTWFDDKVSTVLEQSLIVGESYITEHVLQLKETAISVSDDLAAMYYELVHDADYMQKVLDAQVEFRGLDEAIIFKRESSNILAQTSLSFSLSFVTIPPYLFAKVDKNEVVRIPSEKNKIRILIKIPNYSDTYLLIGRLIDSRIIDHIDKTNGTAQEYFRLKSNISDLQIKFGMIFVVLTMILLLTAVIWGRNFAERMVRPIIDLVVAAEKVKNGDLTAQVSEENLKRDEIRVLSSAFNRMVKQIDIQQRDLVVAQRALAWSDVARSVAHEIKNPLTPIQLSAERLLKKYKAEVSDPENFSKYVNNIIKHSSEISVIVSEFVNFARLPASEFARNELISMVNHIIETRRIINDSILYKISSNVDKFDLICDGAQINRVFLNLLQNAEEALQTISSSKKVIEVQIHLEPNKLTVFVLDNGPGFDKNAIKKAKEAYFTTKVKGTGLGLAIVERILQDHYGELTIFNQRKGGAGTKLTFNLAELTRKLK